MRGDYVDVIYRTGSGTVTERVRARTIGSKVDVDEGKANGTFVTVTEESRVGEAIQTARFAKSEVVAIIEGHEKAKSSRKAKATS